MTTVPDPRALQRFTTALEHLIAHTRSHGEDLAQGKALFAADPAIASLFDQAIVDLATAHGALDALLTGIGRAAPHRHAHTHAHEHEHEHEHPHSH